MIHNGFHESLLNSFLASRLHYSCSCTRKQASSTELIHCKQNLPIVPQTRKCIISLFKGNHKHCGAKGSHSDCGSWQSPSSSRWPSCDQAQSQIIRPSCRSCRMASLYGAASLTSQWRVCSDLYQWLLPERLQPPADEEEAYLTTVKKPKQGVWKQADNPDRPGFSLEFTLALSQTPLTTRLQ